jgi:DNA protecting protein DprA
MSWNMNVAKIELLKKLPDCLVHIHSPPKQLFVAGDGASLGTSALAIVGTRKASPYGLRMAFIFARELAAHGFTIVSGLARGIDGAAHEGALKAAGKTIAVLGHGLDRIYPREHAGLAGRICNCGGALVTEHAVGVAPLPAHFPSRNRIIAGLSMGVIVIEASLKSGSLITAQFAADEGRDVFVLPGRASDTGFQGSHRLIQQGAKLVMNTMDVLGDYGFIARPDSVDAKGGEESMNELKQYFESRGGVVFFSSLWEKKELRRPFELALQSSQIVECGVQCYVWAESSAAHATECLPSHLLCEDNND